MKLAPEATHFSCEMTAARAGGRALAKAQLGNSSGKQTGEDLGKGFFSGAE